VHKNGPRIRLTARKKVPQNFEKFTWNLAKTYSGSPSPTRASSNLSPIPDPRGDPSKARNPRLDLVHEIRDPRAQDNSTHVFCISNTTRSKHATRSVPLPRRTIWPARSIIPVRTAHFLIWFGLETLIWEFLAHLKPDLGHSSTVMISTARSIIIERIKILIFATKGSKGGKVLNQVKVFGKILTDAILI
jgi:hypothetical protein